MEVNAKHYGVVVFQVSHFYNREPNQGEVERILDEILFTERKRGIDILGTLPSDVEMEEIMGETDSLFIRFARTMFVIRHIANLRSSDPNAKTRAMAIGEKMAEDLWSPICSDGIANLVELSLDKYW